jgi:hypothetical protein
VSRFFYTVATNGTTGEQDLPDGFQAEASGPQNTQKNRVMMHRYGLDRQARGIRFKFLHPAQLVHPVGKNQAQ